MVNYVGQLLYGYLPFISFLKIFLMLVIEPWPLHILGTNALPLNYILTPGIYLYLL
jgi:hypothetical protein